MKKEIIYSIIIPHKNIPKLLQRCLDSIPQRADTEIIIVDDNSDPNIVDFNNFPGKDRKNTTVILDKNGGGAGHARNLGLEVASGKKLLFADADDYFNYCIRDVLEEYKNDEHDVVFFNMSSADSALYTTASRSNYIGEILSLKDLSYEECLRKMRFGVGSPCSKLILKSIVIENNIRFDETPIHNDTRFAYLIGFYSKSFYIDERAIYCATYRETSISHIIDDEKLLHRIRVLAQRDAFLHQHGIKYLDLIDMHIMSMADLLESKKIGTYKKGLDIFKDVGFTDQQVEQRIQTFLKDRKRRRIKKKTKRLIKRILFCRFV